MRMRVGKLLIIFLSLWLTSGAAYGAITVQDKYNATQRMVDLTIIEGFPDGTLRLEETVTRAQMAKIALTLKGFSEADLFGHSTAQFPDVTINQWYTAWINTAYAHGILIGDPSGRFRPNDSVSYQEAVTIILRLLGYEDLPYHWPTNYLEKGEEIGLTQDVFSRPENPAPRGDLFVLMDRALDKEVVSWNTSEGAFIPNETNDTLLTTMLEQKPITEGRITKNYRTEDGYNRNEIWIETGNERTSGQYFLPSGNDPDHLLGLQVRVQHSDRSIRSIQVLTDPASVTFHSVSQVRMGSDQRLQSITLLGNSERQLLTDDFIAYVNFSPSTLRDNQRYYGKIVFEGDRIAFVSLYQFLPDITANVVVSANETSIVTWKGAGENHLINFDQNRRVHLVTAQLQPVEQSLVLQDKLLYGFMDRNNELYLIVGGQTRSGTLSSLSAASLTVGGLSYPVRGGNYTTFSANEDKDIAWYRTEDSKLTGMRNKEVELLLDLDGTVRHIKNLTSVEREEHFGLLVNAYGTESIDHRMFRIFTEQGTLSNLAVESSSDWRIFGGSSGYFNFNDDRDLFIPIRYERNDQGEIAQGSIRIVLAANELYNYNGFNLSGWGAVPQTDPPVYRLQNSTLNGESNYIQDGTRRFFVDHNTVIMKVEEDEFGSHTKEALLSWDRVRTMTAQNIQGYVVGTPGDTASFIVLTQDFTQIAGRPLYGIVTGIPFERGGVWMAPINVYGEGRGDYIIERRTSVNSGDLVEFILFGNREIEILTRYSSTAVERFRDVFFTVGMRADNALELLPTGAGGSAFWYTFTDDTLIFDYSDGRYTTSMRRSSIREGDRVVLLHDNRELRVILKVNYLR